MSKRSEQISEVIKHELNNYLIKESEPPKDTLLTITKVEVTEDLERAFISLSVLPINKTGTVLKFIKKELREASRYLKKHMALRRVPKLEIVVDDSALKLRSIDRALDE